LIATVEKTKQKRFRDGDYYNALRLYIEGISAAGAKSEADGVIRFRRFWADCDGHSAVLLPSGIVFDHVESVKYNARKFCELVNADFISVMNGHGTGHLRPVSAPKKPKPEPLPETNLTHAWHQWFALAPDSINVADNYLERVRGIPLGATHSGYAALYPGGAGVLKGEKGRSLGAVLGLAGPVIVFPQRCPETAIVRAIQVRHTNPPKDFEGPKCRHYFKQKSEAGVPYLFGQVPGLLKCEWSANVRTIVLCEGSIDTFTAEALAASDGAVFSIGVAGTGGMVSAAKYLASKKDLGARVVIAFHIDDRENPGSKPGGAVAADARQVLRDAGKSADLFNWGDYIRGLRGIGFPSSIPNDLNESLTMGLDAGIEYGKISKAFLGCLNE
jgi:hypothetical protein